MPTKPPSLDWGKLALWAVPLLFGAVTFLAKGWADSFQASLTERLDVIEEVVEEARAAATAATGAGIANNVALTGLRATIEERDRRQAAIDGGLQGQINRLENDMDRLEDRLGSLEERASLSVPF